MRRLLVFFSFLFFIGCATKGINIYIPVESNIKNENIVVIDQRKNKNIIGYIYKRGEIVEDITFSTDLDRYFLSKLSKIDKNVQIYIKNLFLKYDKSKLTGENIEGKLVIKMEFIKNGQKVVRVINIQESRWIGPINYAKEIEKFTKKILDEGVKHIYKILKER